MGTHFEPALYQEVVAGFVSEMHGVAIRFGIEQPLVLIHLPAEVAHGIRQLSWHMRLSDSDTDWLLRVLSRASIMDFGLGLRGLQN